VWAVLLAAAVVAFNLWTALSVLPWRTADGSGLGAPWGAALLVNGAFLISLRLWWLLRARYFPDSGAGALVIGIVAIGCASMTYGVLRQTGGELSGAAGYFFGTCALMGIYRGLHASSRRIPWFLAAGLGLVLAAGCQLIGMHGAPLRHFSAAYVRLNAYVYYLAPAQWSGYFPFVEPIHVPPVLPGHRTGAYVFGILANVPFAWIALLAPLALLRRPPEERHPLAVFLGAAAVLHVLSGGSLLFFATSAARFLVHFAPTLIFLACVGLLTVERLVTERGTRNILLAACGAVAFVSACVCSLLYFQPPDLLRQSSPRLYQSLAHAFDQPAWRAEQRAGARFGPLDIVLRFPEGRTGQVEPLVTTGWGSASDCILVNYLDNHRLRIGFAHGDDDVWWGRPLSLDYGSEHRLNVSMGSLFPPKGHPFFDTWNDLQYGAFGRWLEVTFDGAPVLNGGQDFYDSSPESLWIGQEPANAHGGHFTGRISRTDRQKVFVFSPPTECCGPTMLRLSIPPNAADRRVPLVTTGGHGRGDALILRAVRPGIIRFYYDHWGSELLDSGDIPLRSAPSHVMLVSMPSLWPYYESPSSILHSFLFLILDGRRLVLQKVPHFEPKPGEVRFGSNGIGSALCEAEFPWAIREVRPIQPKLVRPSLPVGTAAWAPPADKQAVLRDSVELKSGG